MSGALRRAFAALALPLLLGACVRLIPEGQAPRGSLPAPVQTPAPVPTPSPQPIFRPAIKAGPAVGSLSLPVSKAAPALASFRESCPRLLSRADGTGFTRNDDWRPACTAAAAWPDATAEQFFAAHFETAVVGDGVALATGYFEPEIAGTRTRQPGYDVPVYGLPPDLIRCWPASVPLAEQTGRVPLGRIDEAGQCVLYFDRAQIEDGALANRGLEIGWAADPVEFFFLQIQGSGRLRAPDGSVVRIGYAGQNGRDYVGIGGLMRDRGLLGDGPGQYSGSMQGIMRYLREHPAEGRALMRENPSWVFFRELTGDGPIGALGVPVRPRVSVAADPAFVPLGAPVWLSLDRSEANGLWIAQDTGGAIKGPNRFDTFWGTGPEARTIAGGMSGRGQALVFLPKGTVARLLAQ